MRELFSLSLKYLQRQKLRTLLSFLSITLSVFILSVGVTAIFTARASGERFMKQELGSAEVDIGWWFSKEDALQSGAYCHEMLDKVRNHPVVEAYDCSYGVGSVFNTLAPMNCGDDYQTGWLQVEMDKETIDYLCSVDFTTNIGNPELSWGIDLERYSVFTNVESFRPRYNLENGHAFVSSALKQYGYQEGDTLTLTLRTKTGYLDMDSDVVKECIEDKLAESKADAEIKWMYTELLDEYREKYPDIIFNDCGELMGGLLCDKYIDRIPLRNVQELQSETFSFIIDGFYPDTIRYSGNFRTNSFNIYTSFDDCKKLDAYNETFVKKLEEIPAFRQAMEEMDGSIRSGGNVTTCALRIIPGIDFDEGLETLFMDLGLGNGKDRPAETVMFETLNNPQKTFYREELLMFEFRHADTIMKAMIVYAILAVMLLILWFLMRFVIDNSFEISVQERGKQFTALRIMGASQGQIAFLVMSEATLYAVTALPLGILLAHLFCNVVVVLFRNLGFSFLTVDVNPLAIGICILLSALAVYISAYTSSMWAVRRLSLSEAQQLGKPVSVKKPSIFTRDLFGEAHSEKMQKKKMEKQEKKYASPEMKMKAPKKVKLYRSKRSFLMHYTFRNIKRSMRRFVISTVALCIGVLCFSLGAEYLLLAYYNGGKDLINDIDDDFYLSLFYDEQNIRKAEQVFSDEALFSKMDVQICTNLDLNKAENIQPMISAAYSLLPERYRAYNEFTDYNNRRYMPLWIEAITKREYDAEFAPLTRMSYEEWVKTGSGILNKSKYGPYKLGDYEPQTIKEKGRWAQYEEYGFDSYRSFGLFQMPTVEIDDEIWMTKDSAIEISLLGTICRDSGDATGTIYIPEALLATKYSYLTKQLNTSIVLYMTSIDAYDEALKLVYQFKQDAQTLFEDEQGLGWRVVSLYDNHIFGSGLPSLIKASLFSAAGLLLMIWLVGMLCMVNTINTSVINRQDEFHTLHAVGITNKGIRGMVILESLLFNSVSTLLGIGLSAAIYLGTQYLWKGMDQPFPDHMVTSMVIVLVGMFLLNLVVAMLAALPSLNSLKKRMEQNHSSFVY